MAEMWISMGPQHPMTHGLWRLRVKVDGEVITDADPDLGWLHRGKEKLAEMYEYPFYTIFTDRLCYASPNTWTHVYCATVERLMGVELPDRVQWMRVITLEMQRIASHLMWFAAYGPDLGLFPAAVYGFREREDWLDLFQAVCGARMNYNYVRVGGLRNDFPPNWTRDVLRVCTRFEEKLKDYRDLSVENDIFRLRTQGVGVLTKEQAVNLGVTGPNIRGSGGNVDIRKDEPYEKYDEVDFDVPVYAEGDCYARFMVRLDEMQESVNILRQAIETMAPKGPYRTKVPRFAPDDTAFFRAEDSRGESLMYLIGDGSPMAYRLKIRSPMFVTVAASPVMLVGNRVADIPAILGSIDMCIGETDK